MNQLAIRTKKHPNEVLMLQHDWSAAIVTGDALSTVTITVLSGDVNVDSDQIVAELSQYWVSGGTEDTVFRLTATTALGRTYVEDILLRVE